MMSPIGVPAGGCLAVVGLAWGDEGKGKVIDGLIEAGGFTGVVRWSGGPNAGHTVWAPPRGGDPGPAVRVVLHGLPSGVLHPGILNLVGPGCLVDPIGMGEELAALEAGGWPVAGGDLVIDRGAGVIAPWHRELDRRRESGGGGPTLGTTLRGMGPASEDRMGRRGLRLGDLHPGWGHPPDWAVPAGPGDLPAGCLELQAAGAALQGRMGDVPAILHEHLAGGGRALLEGAQGTFLDTLHGTYPWVTGTPTVAGAAPWGAGMGPRRISGVLGVTKAYTTRVGAGPFPTELHGVEGERLREAGGEWGATTGRPRRCGWFDVPLTRRAVMLNGAEGMVITKLDVLGGQSGIRLCRSYDGDPGAGFPWDLREARPVWEEVRGWPVITGTPRGWVDLPHGARAYIDRIEELVGVEVVAVSVSPLREGLLFRDGGRAGG